VFHTASASTLSLGSVKSPGSAGRGAGGQAGRGAPRNSGIVRETPATAVAGQTTRTAAPRRVRRSAASKGYNRPQSASRCHATAVAWQRPLFRGAAGQAAHGCPRGIWYSVRGDRSFGGHHDAVSADTRRRYRGARRKSRLGRLYQAPEPPGNDATVAEPRIPRRQPCGVSTLRLYGCAYFADSLRATAHSPRLPCPCHTLFRMWAALFPRCRGKGDHRR